MSRKRSGILDLKQKYRDKLIGLMELYILQWILPRYTYTRFDLHSIQELDTEAYTHIHHLLRLRVASCVQPDKNFDLSDLTLKIACPDIAQLSTGELKVACQILTTRVRHENTCISIAQ